MGKDMIASRGKPGRVAIVCAEWFPWRCHRRFIALELEKKRVAGNSHH
jgi:uncharacterized protein (DUF488 family)